MLLDEETRRNPLALLDVIQREGVTVWDTVPSILAYAISRLEELNEERRVELLDNQLRKIFTTGEPLLWNTVHAWRRLSSLPASIVNLYSQTETTGTVCIYSVPNDDFESQGFVPLGRPIARTGICLLDEQNVAVEDGEVGEICVAGDRFASGYDRQSNLVSERFVEVDGVSGEKVRVFRTGDLGRRRVDGLLEFVVRGDDQLKIRGLRVHLSEVELALKRDPCVANCAVIFTSQGDADIDVSLVAYVVPETGMHVDVDDLRTKTARWLPGFMVPRRIVLLDELPQLPNGKLDRLALPIPETNLPAGESQPISPRSPSEDMLASIWCELLQLDQVSVHDNFFDLGGHSLSATRVISGVKSQVGTRISLLYFFEHPTIAELAEYLDTQ